MKRFFRWTAILVVLLLLCFFLVVPPLVEKRLNRVVSEKAAVPSREAVNLHAQLRIMDLHADSLLWGRDLLKGSTLGAVDVPRMIEGNVALEVFTAVTKSPRGLNYNHNDSNSDTIIWLALAQRWPPRTWNSLTQRARYLAERFQNMAAASEGRLVPIRTAGDLKNYLQQRPRNPKITAGLLGIEGGHALDGRLENLDLLFDAGYRYISLTHFFDDEFAGSSAGTVKGGLTPLGRELVQRMNEKRLIIDLAHTSPRTIQDVLALTKRPVIVSHGGLRGACNNNRNLSDEEARGVARSGGVIGIGFWETAVCGTNVQAIVRSMRYAVNLVGIDHVALGSDFDGAVTVPFDSARFIELTDALLKNGFTAVEIRAIMGENALRFLLENLPE
jgi:membrane dipeptidase